MNSAEDWDFHTWRATLAALPPRSAALIGLAAAERLAGCLRSLQTVTFAVHGRPDRMEAESRCRQRDLATVQALASAESEAVAEASRTEARAEADQWQKTTEQLALFRG